MKTTDILRRRRALAGSARLFADLGQIGFISADINEAGFAYS